MKTVKNGSKGKAKGPLVNKADEVKSTKADDKPEDVVSTKEGMETNSAFASSLETAKKSALETLAGEVVESVSAYSKKAFSKDVPLHHRVVHGALLLKDAYI